MSTESKESEVATRLSKGETIMRKDMGDLHKVQWYLGEIVANAEKVRRQLQSAIKATGTKPFQSQGPSRLSIHTELMDEGKQACKDGKRYSSCPYTSTAEKMGWEEGYIMQETINDKK